MEVDSESFFSSEVTAYKFFEIMRLGDYYSLPAETFFRWHYFF